MITKKISKMICGVFFVVGFLFLFAPTYSFAQNGFSQGSYVLQTSDPYEPNNSFAQAYGPLDSGVIYQAYIQPDDDYDYYKVEVSGTGIFEAILRESSADATYDLCLYREDATRVICDNTYGDDPVHIVRNGLSPGIYYLLVKLSYGSPGNRPYTLQVFIPGQPLHTSPPIGEPTYEPNDAFMIAYGPLDSGVIYQAYIQPDDDYDYYKVEVSGTGIFEAILRESSADATYDLCLYREDATRVICDNTYGDDPVHIVRNGLSPGIYYLLVKLSYGSPGNRPYSLQLFTPATPTPSPTPTNTPTPTATPFKLYLPVIIVRFNPLFTPTPTLTPTPTPTITPSPTQTPTPVGWIQIVNEDFEGEFPTGLWHTSQSSENGSFVWAPRDCNAHTGTKSAWSVGGGADGIKLVCGDDYPNETTTQLIYGPFDLSDAKEAYLQFWSWSNTEYESDTIFWGASTDGIFFWGKRDSGTDTYWKKITLDFSNIREWGEYKSYLGEPKVWIMFSFESDEWYAKEGWYIDDVLIKKRIVGNNAHINKYKDEQWYMMPRN